MDNVTKLFRRKRINQQSMYGNFQTFPWLICHKTKQKQNFPERVWADNGKNRNIPERNLSEQTIK